MCVLAQTARVCILHEKAITQSRPAQCDEAIINDMEQFLIDSQKD